MVLVEGIEELSSKIEYLANEGITLKLSQITQPAAHFVLINILNNLHPLDAQGFEGRRGKQDWGKYDGGHLLESMDVEKEKSKQGKCYYRITTTWYAHFVEDGFTTVLGIGGHRFKLKGAGHFVTGEHFMRTATDKARAEAEQMMVDGLNEAIEAACNV